MRTILFIILLLLLIGALPSWPYSTGWGYYPSGGLGLVLLIVLLVVLLRQGFDAALMRLVLPVAIPGSADSGCQGRSSRPQSLHLPDDKS